MPERTVVVASRVGLHARPATIFTQRVATSGVPVTITAAGGGPVDASSILFVMSLGIPSGAEVTLAADGPEADRVLDELVELLEIDLDADDAEERAAAVGAGGAS